ncbi:hypothetical protein BDV41DRAFT_527616 [Aspergillus transmontanensis]|uniref:Uncharacterized protein n=1 Tax=Aspergillus transmontanensis TaxID=1034304 RepID=A0A5N6W8L3_9EURO|nr:hypothetical protein BDV41DRAFT_527616 [Aspergillus transmontanensis]
MITLPALTNIPLSVVLASHLLFTFYYAIERISVQDTADFTPVHCTAPCVVRSTYYRPKNALQATMNHEGCTTMKHNIASLNTADPLVLQSRKFQ